MCEWVYDRSDGNAALASVADWLVGRPLLIAVILLTGRVLRWFARRVISRGVNRVLVQAPVLGVTVPAEVASAGVPSREQARRAERAHAVATAVSSTLSALIWALTIIAVVGVLGVDVGPLFASAGLAGIAVAFGAQSLIRDMLAGMFILLEDHYAIGDEVDLGDAIGVVEKVTLRETVLRDLDGTVWHVRNGEIDRVGNHSQVWSAAMVDVTVTHGTDLASARTVLADVASTVAGTPPFDREVIDTPEVLGVEALSADGITLRLLVKTLAGRQFALQRALLQSIVDGFARHGIELATRQVAVHIHRTRGTPEAHRPEAKPG